MDSFIVHSHFNWNIKWEEVLGSFAQLFVKVD